MNILVLPLLGSFVPFLGVTVGNRGCGQVKHPYLGLSEYENSEIICTDLRNYAKPIDKRKYFLYMPN